MDDTIASATEIAVMSVWAQGLPGGTSLAVDDNYFALGGDSMGVLIMVFRFQEIFRIEVPPAVVFDAPTPRLLAQWIDMQCADLASQASCPQPAVPVESAESGII